MNSKTLSGSPSFLAPGTGPPAANRGKQGSSSHGDDGLMTRLTEPPSLCQTPCLCIFQQPCKVPGTSPVHTGESEAQRKSRWCGEFVIELSRLLPRSGWLLSPHTHSLNARHCTQLSLWITVFLLRRLYEMLCHIRSSGEHVPFPSRARAQVVGNADLALSCLGLNPSSPTLLAV